jgi:hypothetical protein
MMITGLQSSEELVPHMIFHPDKNGNRILFLGCTRRNSHNNVKITRTKKTKKTRTKKAFSMSHMMSLKVHDCESEHFGNHFREPIVSAEVETNIP